MVAKEKSCKIALHGQLAGGGGACVGAKSAPELTCRLQISPDPGKTVSHVQPTHGCQPEPLTIASHHKHGAVSGEILADSWTLVSARQSTPGEIPVAGFFAKHSVAHRRHPQAFHPSNAVR